MIRDGRMILNFTELLSASEAKAPNVAVKEHEYLKQTLERYTNCRIEDICDHIVITHTGCRLDPSCGYPEGRFKEEE